MLEHADRNYAIEAAGDVAIVFETKDRVVDPALFHCPLAGAGVLLARKRDAGCAGAHYSSEIERHPPQPQPMSSTLAPGVTRSLAAR